MLSYFLVLFFIYTSSNAQEISQSSFIIPLNKTITKDNKELYSSIINITGLSTIKLTFENVNVNVSFIIFQAHSHLYNITMYNNTFEQDSYITGTNVGLYSPVNPLYTFYVVNPNERELKLLIAVHGYGEEDPVPGGCNMEFGVPTAPYLMTRVSPKKTYVNVEGAAPMRYQNKGCSDSKYVKMGFYRHYLPERDFSIDTYFEGIKAMMNFDSIQENGEFIPLTSPTGLRRTLSAYPGTGSVYVAVGTLILANNESSDPAVVAMKYSVYVPIVSYACSPLDEGDCELLDDLLSKILCASLLFVGIFVCYFGHKFFKTEMFIFGMLSGVIITYIVISLMAELEQAPLIGASFLSGVLFGFIWLTFWWFYGIPVFSVLLCTLNFGFLAACVLFNQMPGGLVILTQDLNFWTVFILIVLLSSLTLASATYPANILCCAILGAYAAVYPIDYCLGSNLKYIVINTIRRATVEKFHFAVVSAPFQIYDALVTLLWVMLATTGFLFQHYHNRGKPPFPPPPRNVRMSPEAYNYGAVSSPSSWAFRNNAGAGAPRVNTLTNERTPLLA